MRRRWQMGRHHHLGSDHEERAAFLHRPQGQPRAAERKIPPCCVWTVKGWDKEKKTWWADDQATDGECQSSQLWWEPTKSRQQRQQFEESRWIEKTKIVHEARCVTSDRKTSRQKCGGDPEREGDLLAKTEKVKKTK